LNPFVSKNKNKRARRWLLIPDVPLYSGLFVNAASKRLKILSYASDSTLRLHQPQDSRTCVSLSHFRLTDPYDDGFLGY